MADSNPSRGPMRKMPTKIAPKPVPTKIAPKPMPKKIAPSKPSSSQPTMADREAARRQNESLRNAKVTPQEGRVIESANRSEGSGMKKGGSMKKYAKGGIAKEMPTSKQMGDLNMAKGGKVKPKMADKGKPFAATKFGAALMKKSADTKGRAMVKMAKGGSVSARADGCATKGKTKTTMVKMARGGATAMRGPRMDYAGVQRKKGGSC